MPMKVRLVGATAMAVLGTTLILAVGPAGAQVEEIAPDPGSALLSEAREVRMEMYRAARSKSCTVAPYEGCEPPDAAALDLNSGDILAAARAQREVQESDLEAPDKQIDSVNYGVKPAQVAKLTASVQDIRVKLRTFDRNLPQGELDPAQRTDARVQLGRISRHLEVAEQQLTKARTKFDRAERKQLASGTLTGGAIQKRAALVNEFNRALLAAFAAEKELAMEYARIAAPVIAEAQLDLEVPDVPTGEFATELFNGTAPADDYGSAFVQSIGVDPNEFVYDVPDFDSGSDFSNSGPTPTTAPKSTTTTKAPTTTVKAATTTTRPPAPTYDVNAARASMQAQTRAAQEVIATADAETNRLRYLRSVPASRESWIAYGQASCQAYNILMAQRAKLSAAETNMGNLKAAFDAAGGEAKYGSAFMTDAGAAYVTAGAGEKSLQALLIEYAEAKKMADAFRAQGVSMGC
jgi:hypothetical protein